MSSLLCDNAPLAGLFDGDVCTEKCVKCASSDSLYACPIKANARNSLRTRMLRLSENRHVIEVCFRLFFSLCCCFSILLAVELEFHEYNHAVWFVQTHKLLKFYCSVEARSNSFSDFFESHKNVSMYLSRLHICEWLEKAVICSVHRKFFRFSFFRILTRKCSHKTGNWTWNSMKCECSFVFIGFIESHKKFHGDRRLCIYKCREQNVSDGLFKCSFCTALLFAVCAFLVHQFDSFHSETFLAESFVP